MQSYSSERWAWEFLRWNEDYRKDSKRAKKYFEENNDCLMVEIFRNELFQKMVPESICKWGLTAYLDPFIDNVDESNLLSLFF